MNSRSGAWVRANYPLVTLILLLAVALVTGGSARDDVPMLALLRPLGVGALVVGLLATDRVTLARYRAPIVMAACWLLLIVVHLIPLPPFIWTAMPGRELAAEVATAAGMAQPWRPIALVPWRAWNAFYAVLVPLAALLLAARCDHQQRRVLLIAVVIGGALSALVAFLQGIGHDPEFMRFYQYTSAGVPTGLLANRNHQAAFLCAMLPLLAAVASDPSAAGSPVRRLVALGVGLGVVPMILATGSRAGLVMLAIALLSVPLIYRTPPTRGRAAAAPPWRRITVMAGIVAILAVIAILVLRGPALARLMSADGDGDARWGIWGPTLTLAGQYFPVGAGIGAFVDVFEIGEPATLLGNSYANHAHNDILELLLDGGIPAMLLLLVAVIGWGRRMTALVRARGTDSQHVRIATAAGIVLLLLGLGSIVDYPIRVPVLACLVAVAAIWMTAPEPERQRHMVRRSGNGG